MSSSPVCHILPASGHAVSIHVVHPYLFVFQLGGQHGEVWVHNTATSKFDKTGSFQLNDSNVGSYYHVNTETVFVDPKLNIFALVDNNKGAPYGDDDVLWNLLRVFSLDTAKLLHTIDLRGQPIGSDSVYSNSRLITPLYPLSANGTEFDYDGLLNISVRLTDSSGSISKHSVPATAVSPGEDADPNPYLHLPRPAAFTGSGDFIAVSYVESDTHPKGLLRWSTAALDKNGQPDDHLGFRFPDHGNPDLSSDMSWTAPLGDGALIICLRTRNMTGISDMDFHETSTLYAVDVTSNGLKLRWTAEPLRGVAQTARYDGSLDSIVVIGQHDFAGHEENGEINAQEYSEGHGMTSWIAVLDPRTGVIGKHDALAHKKEEITVAYSGFSASQNGLHAVFGLTDGSIYLVSIKDWFTHRFPRDEYKKLALQSAFKGKIDQPIRGGAVGDGYLVILISDQEEAIDNSSSQCLYYMCSY